MDQYTQIVIQEKLEESLYTQRVVAVTPTNRMYYYNGPELAEYFKVSPPTVYKWIKAGYMPYVHQGGRYYVHESVVAWLERQGRSVIVRDEYRKLLPKAVHLAVEAGTIDGYHG